METKEHVREILDWHLNVGVDETIGELPVDRFQDLPQPAKATVPTSSLSDSQVIAPLPQRAALTTPAPNAMLTADESVHSAVELAGAAGSLAELRTALERFEDCALKKTAMNLVFADGEETARLVFIGEAPGAEEDRQGIPFVGPSGKLLDRMLSSIGLERSQVLISNTVFWRPPGNRTPTPQETATCMPFVERLLEIVDPDVLVTLGGPASKALLGETQGVGRLRGRWFTFSTPRLSHPIDTTAMFHPAYLLRTPAQKRNTWADLLAIKRKLDDGQ